MRWSASSSTRIGAGVQPVPGPTLPESSSADRKPWLTNGSLPTSRSQARGFNPETPEAILAMISVSWSAIAFPDEGVGMNRGLRALRGSADRPGINRHAIPDARNPRNTHTCPMNSDELRRDQSHGQPALEERHAFAEHQASNNMGGIPSKPPSHLRIEAHYADCA